jgi:hypothetical protein
LPQIESGQKLLVLELGDCIDVAKFSLSENKDYVIANEYRVSNINNSIEEKLTLEYTLSRFGK